MDLPPELATQPTGTLDLEDTVAVLRAAGEPTRLRILALLSRYDLTVKDLTGILGQSQPRVSRHLKLLAEAGLAVRSAEGAFAYYRAADGPQAGLVACALARIDPSDPTIERDRERCLATRRANATAAADYFAANAEVWDQVRALHAPEGEVERAIFDLLGDAPVRAHLDIGTGTGRMLELFASRTQRAVGVDASAAMLAVARANLERAGIHHARLAQGDIGALSQPRDAFDLITIHQVLHYLDDPGRAIAEAARALRPGGRMLIVDFAPHDVLALRHEAQHRRLGIADDEMDAWIAAAGLRMDKTHRLAGEATLTVSFWLATDPRVVTDDVRPREGVFLA